MPSLDGWHDLLSAVWLLSKPFNLNKLIFIRFRTNPLCADCMQTMCRSLLISSAFVQMNPVQKRPPVEILKQMPDERLNRFKQLDNVSC